MLKYNIVIQIDDIEVNDGYYSFKWTSIIEKKKSSGRYDSDYEGNTPKQFKKILENGYALEIVLDKIGEGF